MKKTGIKKIHEIRNFLDADYKWSRGEQIIIDAFKTVEEIGEIARAKKQEQEVEQEEKI